MKRNTATLVIWIWRLFYSKGDIRTKNTHALMWAAMYPLDFSTLLDAGQFESLLLQGQGTAPSRHAYLGCEGAQFRSQEGRGELVQEMVRLSEHVFLLASDYSPQALRRHCQIINDCDWLHVQFRLRGGGRERIFNSGTIETPEGSCTITRYPKNSVIERIFDATDRWRVACLFASPTGLADFLDTSASQLSERVSWLAREDPLELRTTVLPLTSASVLAVNDILSCQFQGRARRTYMRAKSLELLSLIMRALDDQHPYRAGIKLSVADMEKISLSRALMTENLECNLTLAQLARRIGLNRTKLALGFKQAYGTSVQAYWRDARLSRARELLRGSGPRVTEVALSLGYSELSSFTRAFRRKFGVLPRECRGSC